MKNVSPMVSTLNSSDNTTNNVSSIGNLTCAINNAINALRASGVHIMYAFYLCTMLSQNNNIFCLFGRWNRNFVHILLRVVFTVTITQKIGRYTALFRPVPFQPGQCAVRWQDDFAEKGDNVQFEWLQKRQCVIISYNKWSDVYNYL